MNFIWSTEQSPRSNNGIKPRNKTSLDWSRNTNVKNKNKKETWHVQTRELVMRMQYSWKSGNEMG